ncbi:hypothetical protein [Micromonospora sp. NPDC005197]|uniref:hypothetical protein n=1 Tax=Micromonospora sp. NPDC005197 TaxID=3157020 RepID=UPI0033A4195F
MTADKVARAVTAAQEAERAKAEPQPRADRDWLVADAARRYGLGDALAAMIKGDTAAEIQRDARRLTVERSTLLAAEAEVQPEAPRLAPVSGRAPADQGLYDFDPTDVVRQVRQPY